MTPCLHGRAVSHRAVQWAAGQTHHYSGQIIPRTREAWTRAYTPFLYGRAVYTPIHVVGQLTCRYVRFFKRKLACMVSALRGTQMYGLFPYPMICSDSVTPHLYGRAALHRTYMVGQFTCKYPYVVSKGKVGLQDIYLKRQTEVQVIFLLYIVL